MLVTPLCNPVCGPGFVYFISGAETGGTGVHKRNSVRSATDWSNPAHQLTYGPGSPDAFCFDRANQDLFYNNFGDTPPATIYRRSEEDGASESTVGTSGLSGGDTIGAIDCDPANGRLFYVINKSNGAVVEPTLDLRVIGYDGAGDQSLINWLGWWSTGGFPSGMIDCKYDEELNRIYYLKLFMEIPGTGTGAFLAELRYWDLTASTDNLVRAPAGDASNNVFMRSIAIDIQNRYLFWYENHPTFIGTGHIKRSDMDGGSVTNIFDCTLTDAFGADLCFVQALEKLIVWQWLSGSPSSGKISRMDNDGSSVETLLTMSDTTYPDWPFGRSKFAVGRDMEDVGVDWIH